MAFSPFAGYNFCRNMSTLNRDDSDKISVMSDVADVLTDTSMDAGILTETVVDAAAVSSQAPVVSEVVIAAADSYLPVQALQYAIDAVHSFTGLNW
jgi:YidC/Oxa1 family membrane protein insertase